MSWYDKQSCKFMSIENLRIRLNYYGKDPEDRLIKDKRRSLSKALLYSYQGVTISLVDRNDPNKFTRDFRALLNPNKLNLNYDNKILSIPYEDIQLNTERVGKTLEGWVDTEIKAGDVFYWAETDTYWIVYMQFLDERAYFRGEVRLCEKTVDIDGTKYHIYYRGPIEQQIAWQVKKGDIWNNPNYSGLMFITKNEQTSEYFHRFTKIEIDGQTWEVQVVNEDGGDGILQIALKESYNNSIQKESEIYQKEKQEKAAQEKIELGESAAYISGPQIVKPYDIVTYKINNVPYEEKAVWKINNNKANILSVEDFTMTMEIVTGRSGEITLSYIYGSKQDERIDYQIQVKSL